MYKDVLHVYSITNKRVADLSVLLRQRPQVATGGPTFVS